jgi:EpsI family protein
MNYRSLWVRFSVVAALFVGTACVLFARPAEHVPASQPLSAFPQQIGNWRGKDVEIPASALEILGPGDFLDRLYTTSNGLPADLFIAYFASQSTGDTIHSPKNCLPGAGWTPVQSGSMPLVLASGKQIQVNRYIIAKGTDRQLVVYWYQAHGRAVASEYGAKFYLVADAIRMNRTDGALIRVITPILPTEDVQKAEMRVVDFVGQAVPNLRGYIPD